MIKIRHILLMLLVPSLVFLLTGCAGGVLDPAGHIAASERRLLIEALILMFIIVIPVVILNLVIAFHYRASNKKAKYSPEWSHSVTLEIICWAIPCIIIFILSVMTWVYTHRLDPYRLMDNIKGKPLTIQVIALDWRWLFIYPEQHIATINFMQVPLNRDIQLLVTGDGSPMNSIEMPQLAGQIYAMPAMQTKLHFDVYKAGDYRGLSTNYSGDGFAGMMFTVRATSNADFNAWVKKAQKSPDALTQEKYEQLIQPSTDAKVRIFTSPDKNLYDYIMNKYMMPSPAVLQNIEKHDSKATH